MATAEQLLNDAILAMAELHDSMVPDADDENAIVPPSAVRKFVDAHARLMYERERIPADVALARVRAAVSDVTPFDQATCQVGGGKCDCTNHCKQLD